jgi:aminocarboxymuconate-semialdehyde decarboxylase
MPSRRTFLSAAGLAAGYFVVKPVAWAQGRKEVHIAGKRVKTVDIHAHASIQAVEEVIRGTPVERRIGGPRLLEPSRLTMMDEWGIDVSAISANQYWWYETDDRALARDIIRVQDEGFRDWVARYPDRFVALTSPALQFPDLAAEQLDYAVNRLGFRGASIAGHVNGVAPVTEEWDVFWSKCEELDVPVFMHPAGAENIVMPDGLEFPGDLGNTIGNPLETTFLLTRMIYENTFDRHPNLKIVGAHGGGFLPSYVGRTEQACNAGAEGCNNQRPVRDYLRTQILADTMVFSDEGLRHLVAEMGASQVVYGTDMPLGWPDTMDLIINSVHLSDYEKEMILGGNLIRLLRIDPTI